MNDPNKTINVNLSSLLSLKAELLRKQNEVRLAKATKGTLDDHIAKKRYVARDVDQKSSSSTKCKNNKKQAPSKSVDNSNEDGKAYELEDSAQLEKSRRVLEAKSKFYDRMIRTGGSLNSDDNCLVLFNRKRQNADTGVEERQQHDRSATQSSSDSSHSESEDEQEKVENNRNLNKPSFNDDADDDENEWIEFVDCLGRTRRVLRTELEDIKRRDKELAESMPERMDQTKANWMIDTKGTEKTSASDDGGDDDDASTIGPRPTESLYSVGLSTMSKLEEQRVNWERKEQENFEKPDVHYQDVFFDEARMHGVGYYAFSTDETERKEQQRQLEAARKATTEAQEKQNTIRQQRDRQIADRVFAAKNRIRARNGLQLLTREEFESEQNKPKEFEIEANKAERKAQKKLEKLERIKAEEEAAREEERQTHVRPWDEVKLNTFTKATDADYNETENNKWQYKSERLPMSQEEWNEQQRALRMPEFAPIPENEIIPKRTNFSSMPPPPSQMYDKQAEFDKFTPYQSTKCDKTCQRRNYSRTAEANSESETSQRGAAIPPPDNLDTPQLPPIKRAKTNEDLSRSIEAGLRFLRESSDKRKTCGKSNWSAKADY